MHGQITSKYYIRNKPDVQQLFESSIQIQRYSSPIMHVSVNVGHPDIVPLELHPTMHELELCALRSLIQQGSAWWLYK